MDEIDRLKTLLFIHQQFGNDDYPDEWMEDWQAFVDKQPSDFMAMIEANLAELPRPFRTRYRKWRNQ